MSDREERAKSLASANGIVRDGEHLHVSWEEMRPTERDLFRRQAEREGYSSEVSDGSSDRTNAAAYVATAMRGRLDDIATLGRAASGDIKDRGALDPLGVDTKGQDDATIQENAEQALRQYPICVEAMTVFEIVLGTGGPDDRLIVECSQSGESTLIGTDYREEGSYEIERILYRYSWMGSGEVVLVEGTRDFAAAERFARWVVPELE